MKTRKLRQLSKTLDVISLIAGIVAFIGFFLIIGGVGNWDYADETNTIMTAAEDAMTWRICIAGIIMMGGGSGIVAGCEKVNARIYDILEERKRRYKARKLAERKRCKQRQAEVMAFMQKTPVMLSDTSLKRSV